jgi:type IV pilus assembly protein PilB
MALPRVRIGQLLVDAGLVSREALDAALEEQKADGRRLGTLLVERGLVDETQLTQILSHQLSVPWVSLLHIEFSRQLLNLVPREVAEKFCVVPIYVRHVRGQGDTLYVAMDDPSNEDALRECAAFSGLPVRSMIAPPSDIRSAIRVYYGGPPSRPASEAPATAKAPVEAAAEAAAGEHPGARRSDRGRARGSLPQVEPGPGAASAPAAAPVPRIEPMAQAPTPAAEPAPSAPAAPAETADEGPSIEHTVLEIPHPRGGSAARMVSLTLLDGTTIKLPARRVEAVAGGAASPADAPPSERRVEELTARDLVAALRAAANGADASEVLGAGARWEPMFAALLSLMLKKQLIADWEFVEELERMT